MAVRCALRSVICIGRVPSVEECPVVGCLLSCPNLRMAELKSKALFKNFIHINIYNEH